MIRLLCSSGMSGCDSRVTLIILPAGFVHFGIDCDLMIEGSGNYLITK